MRFVGDSLVLSPTDLSGFLTCRHRTGLDLAVASGALEKPAYIDPFAATLQRLGDEHERRYVESLRETGLLVVDLAEANRLRQGSGESAEALRAKAEASALHTDDDTGVAQTIAAMRDGADAIVQARLEHGDLAGYADVLLRVDEPSDLGAWSYEAQDTKLARETKGGTILQLTAYSMLVAELQGRMPERFHVVTPDPVTPVQTYRVDDYIAYYRMVSSALREAATRGHEVVVAAHYPEPVEACDVCRWEARCLSRRRADDHTSLIANAGRVHRVELARHGYATLEAAATMAVPVTFTPSRGARQTYDRIGHQARVQHQQRREHRPIHETLAVVAGEGLCRLPEPSPGDLFLDLEGARFAREDGREYLFGVWGSAEADRLRQGSGESAEALRAKAEASALRTNRMKRMYRAFWATSDAEERAAFEQVMDLIMDAWARDPGMHVYHFNHYEPTAFKKLMGRHATRAEALDQLLRAERFVDLYPITRQALRAGVESYSIKKLEPFTGYIRAIALADVNHALRTAELALESGAPASITDEIRALVTGYNEDDCRSTEALRDWLESLRAQLEADGTPVPRPALKEGDASPKVTALQAEVERLRARLLDGVPADPSGQSDAERARWLLAYLIDWHRRADKAEWWEFYRLCELSEDDLLDERKAVAGLELVERVARKLSIRGTPTGTVTDRYRYPEQDLEIGVGDELKLQDGLKLGTVRALDRLARTIDIEKGPTMAERHPRAAFAHKYIDPTEMQRAIMRLAEAVLDAAAATPLVLPLFEPGSPRGCGLDLLFRRPPRLRTGRFERVAGETDVACAVRLVGDLDATALAIQGPPGAGKTYTGAQMIRALVNSGRRVGVTANSHKVIRNLLDEVRKQSTAAGAVVRLGHKVSAEASDVGGLPADTREFTDNPSPLAAFQAREIDVLGGTPFLWARAEYAGSVDVLFVDEAGQMSLANALAVSQAAESLVLLGDPQQLEQPQKGSHPDGVSVSALEHVLGGAATMPRACGLFLPTTWRLAPAICDFTSEAFYEGKLRPKEGLETQRLVNAGPFDGAGLWFVPVDQDGNQSASIEEVDAVQTIVGSLLSGGGWIDEQGVQKPLRPDDFRIVAPYNAQVNRLTERLAGRGVPVGTVDKFQGQEAPVVIYSMATSRPEDAPRGMEFLYSLNRLNVATSRARCAVILVASPRLFEAECRTPRQMQLANALCRYREMARVITSEAVGV